MRSAEHQKHIDYRTCHARCPECNADRERQFVDSTPFQYQHVHEYLSWIRPRLQAIREGTNTVNSRIWLRKFHEAMDRRISSHLPRKGRKYCDSYLERLRISRGGSNQNVDYLRRFAARNASALD